MSASRKPHEREAALATERRSQLRGLLVLAAIVLLILIVRAQPLHLFGANWWMP